MKLSNWAASTRSTTSRAKTKVLGDAAATSGSSSLASPVIDDAHAGGQRRRGDRLELVHGRAEVDAGRRASPSSARRAAGPGAASVGATALSEKVTSEDSGTILPLWRPQLDVIEPDRVLDHAVRRLQFGCRSDRRRCRTSPRSLPGEQRLDHRRDVVDRNADIGGAVAIDVDRKLRLGGVVVETGRGEDGILLQRRDERRRRRRRCSS